MNDTTELHKAISELHASATLIMRSPKSTPAILLANSMTDKAQRVTKLAQSTLGACYQVPSAPYDDSAESKAYDEITYQYDGPLTTFVVIARATEHAKNSGKNEETANALYRALQDMGLKVEAPYFRPPFEC